MERKEYNGWTNYETWNLNLWLGEDSWQPWTERAQELLDDAEGDREEAARKLADEIEADMVDNAPDMGGFYGDILSAALREVNFLEIAEHYVADAEYTTEEEPEAVEEFDAFP